MNEKRLINDIKQLSYIYPLAVDEENNGVIIKNFNLPKGYNRNTTSVLLEIPNNYPITPPGVGKARIYLPMGLRFNGKTPCDYHEYSGPDNWAWWCYEWIKWNPRIDNFVTFLELLRAHMTNPKTKGFFSW
jgi:ubiquitin-protein ligase